MIMLVSVDPTSGAVAAASIPRDTTDFPLPDGSTFEAKVNGLYQSYVASVGEAEAGRLMKVAVGEALAVEIDVYVVIGFEGVKRLVDAVGGVDVTLAKAVNDPAYWLSQTERGVYFPAGVNHLTGERALIFARTRKGDNDFERARRQQLLIAATVDAVTARGLAILPDLLDIAATYVKTDLPLDVAPQVYGLVDSADTADATRVVFGPTKWASSTGGSSFALRLTEVRAWTARWMAPVVEDGGEKALPGAAAAP